ncbi:MAG: hypothetical protein AB7O49_07170 [Sphingomonadales bacterium]
MSRLAIICAIAVLLPAGVQAGSYRAGPLGAWDQNGEFSCEGGDLLVFPGGDFAVVPRPADDRTIAVIDSRSGRAKVGGTAAADLERLTGDPDICAGPVDCDDWDGVGKALERCWSDGGPIN